MRFLFLLFKGVINRVVRNIYWLFNASRITMGSGCVIEFPLIVEGKGRVVAGNNVRFSSGAQLKCERGAQLNLADGSVVGRDTVLSVVTGNVLTLGLNSVINEKSYCYAHGQWVIGDNVTIASYCQIFSREQGCNGSFHVGEGSSIGDFSIIDISANVFIGSKVAIGPKTTIYTHDHDYKQLGITAPWKGDPIVKPVIIEDGCWIGSNVTILPGVSVGKNAIIATGAVVNKNVPSATLWGGVPAKQIKELK